MNKAASHRRPVLIRGKTNKWKSPANPYSINVRDYPYCPSSKKRGSQRKPNSLPIAKQSDGQSLRSPRSNPLPSAHGWRENRKSKFSSGSEALRERRKNGRKLSIRRSESVSPKHSSRRFVNKKPTLGATEKPRRAPYFCLVPPIRNRMLRDLCNESTSLPCWFRPRVTL